MDTANESVARIEAIIGREVKRDIGLMIKWAKGNLARAAEAMMNTPNAHVGIVTGFYIQHSQPPSPETDGLGGMAHLAAGLANAGIPVTVITDAPRAKAVWAVVDALLKAVANRISLPIAISRPDLSAATSDGGIATTATGPGAHVAFHKTHITSHVFVNRSMLVASHKDMSLFPRASCGPSTEPISFTVDSVKVRPCFLRHAS